MIKIKKLKKINELFTDYHRNSYDIDSFDGKYWRATTDSGSVIRFSILPLVTGVENFVTFEYLVEYPDREDTFKPVKGEKLDQEKLKIFNTVLSFFESKVYENQYDGFSFSSEREGPLAKLYTAIVRKLDFPNYTKIEKDTYKGRNFSFIKKDFVILQTSPSNLYTNNETYILSTKMIKKENNLILTFSPIGFFGDQHVKTKIKHMDVIVKTFLENNPLPENIEMEISNNLWSKYPDDIDSIMDNLGYEIKIKEEHYLMYSLK